MPQDRASAEELLKGVEDFLRKDILPQVNSGSRYKCRVAANILGIVQRELAEGDYADTVELKSLETLLARSARGADKPSQLDDLNAELCAKIRSGELDAQDKPTFTHVRNILTQKVKIANPKYAGLNLEKT